MELLKGSLKQVWRACTCDMAGGVLTMASRPLGAAWHRDTNKEMRRRRATFEEAGPGGLGCNNQELMNCSALRELLPALITKNQ